MQQIPVFTMRNLFVLLTFCVIANPCLSDEKAPGYKKMPWHLIDLWWDLGEDRSFQSYEIDVTISEDVPSDVRLYVAPIGLGHLDETPFYGGLQTESDGYVKKTRKLQSIGRGLLMSMWGERSLEAIRPSAGGFCQSSGHEGDFISVRRPYEWRAGTYTYRVSRMDEETIDGQPYTWVGAFVYSHKKDENIFIGALRFPGKDLTLKRKIASFVEIYGPRIEVDRIPETVVKLGNLKVNGKRIENPACTAIYPKGVPDYADATRNEDQVVITVGEEVQSREKRQKQLIAP